MRITIVSVGPRRGRSKRQGEELLTEEFLARSSRFEQVDGLWVESSEAFWMSVRHASTRVPAKVFLMDSGGRMTTSVEFAGVLRTLRDHGSQQIFFGVGGPDGWDADSLSRADQVLSIGRWTLPHGLARVVVAEQIYRALTILAGHPYHCGH